MRAPHEIVAFANEVALKKGHLPFKRLVVAGFLAGAYIGMGAIVSVIVGFGFPAVAAANPAFTKLMMGLFFPVGLTLIAMAGGELFTGNCAVLVPNLLNKRLTIWEVLRNWIVVYFSNAVGALFFGYILVYLTGISSSESIQAGLYTIVEAKCSNTFLVTLLKGIGANWMVCLAVWMSFSSEMIVGKVIGMWLPIMAFVVVGYEHCIANMFFLPLAMWEGADITTWGIITTNLIPATIGNIIGGAIFVGGFYWYIYDRDKVIK